MSEKNTYIDEKLQKICLKYDVTNLRKRSKQRWRTNLRHGRQKKIHILMKNFRKFVCPTVLIFQCVDLNFYLYGIGQANVFLITSKSCDSLRFFPLTFSDPPFWIGSPKYVPGCTSHVTHYFGRPNKLFWRKMWHSSMLIKKKFHKTKI
jgi:hypothetical protein